MLLSQTLKQYNKLKTEVQLINTRIFEIKSWLEGSSTRITGLPCSNNKTDKIGNGISDVMYLQKVLDERLRRCLREMSFIELIINTVPDSGDRIILTRRYIYGDAWSKIAQDLGYRSESSIRKKCAYLEKSLSL